MSPHQPSPAANRDDRPDKARHLLEHALTEVLGGEVRMELTGGDYFDGDSFPGPLANHHLDQLVSSLF